MPSAGVDDSGSTGIGSGATRFFLLFVGGTSDVLVTRLDFVNNSSGGCILKSSNPQGFDTTSSKVGWMSNCFSSTADLVGMDDVEGFMDRTPTVLGRWSATNSSRVGAMLVQTFYNEDVNLEIRSLKKWWKYKNVS